uniref:EamA domain-containing protein n=1 Tax=Salix viminalis TaxID=40686 RepID=A0A6N2LQ20_SALVM
MAIAMFSYDSAKPFLAVIFLQFGYAGMFTITKHALDEGMSQHVLVVYRHVVATIIIAPFALIFDRPTIDQNLYYTGMKYTTATFTSAMCNVLPAFAFLMAWALRIEQVNLRKIHSQAKIIGTIVTVGGAMLMTLVKGAQLDLPWTKGYDALASTGSSLTKQDPIKGALMITTGCVCWACFIILQAITLKSYPVELSLTAGICFMGAIEGSVVAAVMERGNPSAWSVGMDYKLLAAVYSGVICSGIGYYVQGLIMKRKGPVFVTAFSPLSMVIVAVLGSFFLKEILYMGRVLGAVVIVTGLYLVLWGKSKDQPPSNSSHDKAAEIATKTSTETQEMTVAGTQEFVASFNSLYNQANPYLLVIFVQFGYSVMTVLAKLALNLGMKPHVLVAYRMAVASILFTPFALVLERPVLDQNLFYAGMKITTPTFVLAMCNILPAMTFVMACIFKLEKVDMRRLHFQAKVAGTLITIGGAMLLTFTHGPSLNFPWTKRDFCRGQTAHSAHIQDPIKGAVMIIFGCLSWSSFIIMQAMILKSYPAKLSLAALMCIMGTVESTILTFAMERANTAIWSVNFDVRLSAVVYGGILSGLAYYILGLLVKERGPVFISASNPLSMIMVAITGSFIFEEKFYLGRVLGSIVIVLGLYLVLWGKSKDQTTTSNSCTVGNSQASNHDLVASNANAAMDEPV